MWKTTSKLKRIQGYERIILKLCNISTPNSYSLLVAEHWSDEEKKILEILPGWQSDLEEILSIIDKNMYR